MKPLFKHFLLLLLCLSQLALLSAQDVRTLETKVADLLARMPANNKELAARMMDDMYSLGEEGISMIFNQIVPPGRGDDTRARYAVSSMTGYLSAGEDKGRIRDWEQLCASQMEKSADNNVKIFFLRQLLLAGSDASLESVGALLRDSLLCSDAVMVLQKVGTAKAEALLLSALREDNCQCTAQIMDALAENRCAVAAELFIEKYREGSDEEKASALLALASTNDMKAMPVLMKAAEDAGYKWDKSGAVASLLLYAKYRGLAGDIKTMDKLTDAVIAHSNIPALSNQRLAAMSVKVTVSGEKALPELLKAADDPDVALRAGVIRLASLIPGEEATKKWMARYKKVSPQAKPDIIFMLGERGDVTALPLVTEALEDTDAAKEALTALPKLAGKGAVEPLISWILKHDDKDGHFNAISSILTVLDSTVYKRVAAAIEKSQGQSTVSLIYLLSLSGDPQYFELIMKYCASEDILVRASAFGALKRVAGYDDQKILIDALKSTTERPEVNELQSALIAALKRSDDEDQRVSLILESLNSKTDKSKLIPVLSGVGGEKALAQIATEFEKGDAETRDICFNALIHWPDISVAKVLYKICLSGNKTFEKAAFDAYLEAVSVSEITPERKILLIKNISPLARAPRERANMLLLAGSIKILPSYLFIKGYLGDDSAEVIQAAKDALENLDLKSGESFVSLFNGKDLSGWKGLVDNPILRSRMKPAEMAKKQKEADEKMLMNWKVEQGTITFNGTGDNLCTVQEYGDFELFVDWIISKNGDSGIYLRGTPQVQIWDTSRTDAGAQVGSGGLYNNQRHQSIPQKVADNPVGEWNTFRITMIGDKVSVWLNGELVTDNVVMENYWDRAMPIFEKGQLELQAHGTDLAFRDIWIREISQAEYNLTEEEKADGFVSLFNGRNLDGWTGNKVSYGVEDGMITIRPGDDSGGNLYTEKEYSDFVFRFEFRLTPDANNGLGIRTPLTGDAAYVGMELQILDNTASVYANLQPYQYHGSVYGVIPALRGFLNPVGEWNYEEVIVQGTKVKIILNGTVIVDGDIADARDNGTIDGKDHPGLKNEKGHIGFLGHGSVVYFRNIRIKETGSTSSH